MSRRSRGLEQYTYASCIIDNYESKLLLLHHRSSQDGGEWSLPGCITKPYDIKEDALSDNVLKSTGLLVSGLKEIGKNTFSDGYREYNETWFWPETVVGIPASRDHGTVDRVEFFSPEDIRGRIFSSNTRKIASMILRKEIELPNV